MDQPTELVFNHLRSIADQAFKLIHDIDARRKLIEQYVCYTDMFVAQERA